MTAPVGQEPVLIQIGDIGVSQSWIITPTGTAPLAGSRWTSIPNVSHQRDIPGWAIVCAVLFFVVCFLGLLFLLVKRETVVGTIDVQVDTATGGQYVTRIPVRSYHEQQTWEQAVMEARRLAHVASLGTGF